MLCFGAHIDAPLLLPYLLNTNDMRPITFFLLLVFLGVGTAAWAGASPDQPNPPADLSAQSITSLAPDDVAAQLGRKLRPVERRQLRRARRLHQRHPEWSPQQAFDAVKPMNLWAIAGFVLGFVSFLVFEGSLILGLLGIVFSAIALYQLIKHVGDQKGLGWAIAGLVMGITGVLVNLIVLGLTALAYATLISILSGG